VIKINRLIDQIQDFEQSTYSFVKERLQLGLILDLNELQSKILLEKKEKTCAVDSLLANSFLNTHIHLRNLRSEIFAPFYYSILFSDDHVEYKRNGSQIIITLVKDGTTRNLRENHSRILKADDYLNELKKSLTFFVNNVTKSIHRNDANYLIKLGLISENNFELYPNKILKGHFVDVDLGIMKEDFNLKYKGNNLWPVNFSSVQQYSDYYNPSRNSSITETSNRIGSLEQIEKMNKDFWAQPVISYSHYMEMIDQYGP